MGESAMFSAAMMMLRYLIMAYALSHAYSSEMTEILINGGLALATYTWGLYANGYFGRFKTWFYTTALGLWFVKTD